MIQLIFNGKKSYTDFIIELESFSIQPASKKKIKTSAPFMNGSYDFSTVGSSGQIIYGERIIKASFNLKEKNRSLLYMKYSKVLEWLLGTGQSKLIFTDMPDYYFMAEVENAPNFEEVIKRGGKLEVEFIAQPFKFGVNFEGSDIWDTFNFEEDVMQDVEFDVVTTETVNIYNPGRLVMPIISCSAAMSITFNSKTYNLVVGDNRFYDLKLLNGENSIVINGTGHISFIFRKVSL